MAKKKKNFMLRIDPELYDVLQRWAQDEFRSVNGHLEFIIREAVKQAGRLPKKKSENEEKEG